MCGGDTEHSKKQSKDTMIIPLVYFIGLFALFHVAHGNGIFGYDGVHGPQHWADEFQTCVGKHQSPINIEEHEVRNITFPTLRFSGLETPRKAFLTNNGHTVMLQLNGSTPAMVFGGPLGSSKYVFEQLHFHWGEHDTEGSEDLINNHSFAMELHAVFYKKSYGSMSKAMSHPDGLTVLAYFFEVSDEDNSNYQQLVAALPEIEMVGSNYSLPTSLVLDTFLSPKGFPVQSYFTYNGSLTTPPCSEVVTWVDFKHPLPLSHAQLNAFRTLRASEGQRLTHNFRPVQPLEDRFVYYNVGKTPGVPARGGARDNQIDVKPGVNSGIGVTMVPAIVLLSVFLTLQRSLILIPWL